MSGKLNHRSPILRLKDSIKKELKKEIEDTEPLNCYDETIEKKYFGRIKDIDELPYETRIGVVKWFKNNKIYEEVITKLLRINPVHIDTMHVPEIDPIKKKFLTLDDIHDLGIEYEPPVLNNNKISSAAEEILDKVYEIKKESHPKTKIVQSEKKEKRILSEKNEEKMRQVEKYLKERQWTYRKIGKVIACPKNIINEYILINKKFNMNYDNIKNIMSWLKEKLLDEQYPTKRKNSNPDKMDVVKHVKEKKSKEIETLQERESSTYVLLEKGKIVIKKRKDIPIDFGNEKIKKGKYKKKSPRKDTR